MAYFWIEGIVSRFTELQILLAQVVQTLNNPIHRIINNYSTRARWI